MLFKRLLLLHLLLLFAISTTTAKNLAFIENVGQVTDQFGNPRKDIDVKINGEAGLTLFLGNSGIHYQWIKMPAAGKANKRAPGNIRSNFPKDKQASVEGCRIDVQLLGASPLASITKELPTSYYERLYLPDRNLSGATAYSFERITYHNVYPNIDWVLYIDNNKLKYDFILHPGAHIADIRMQYNGTQKIVLSSIGIVTAATAVGVVTEQAPVAWQQKDHKPVPLSFRLDDNVLSFSPAAYEGTLVIDPVLQWGTYFGGNDLDAVYDAVLNNDGALYVTGGTNSMSNIATTGAYQTTFGGGTGGAFNDAFLAKFSADGSCLWSTYYGTGAEDCAKSITADTSGNIYIGGYTYSTSGLATTGTYKQTSSGSYDVFIGKFDTSGTRLWGTYYGGPGEDGWSSFGLHCDRYNNLYVTGGTNSATGIATTGAWQPAIADPFGDDGFLAKFNVQGSLIRSTYYGGTGQDDACALTTDTTGAIYVVGYTNSTSGIAGTGAAQSGFGGSFDGFLAKFDSTCSRSWGTYIGGSDFDQLASVTCDDGLNVYTAGTTISTSGIATTGAYQAAYGGGYQDGLIAKYTPGGTQLWASYYGGNSEDAVDKITWAKNGGIYLSGFTGGGTGMVTPGAPQTTPGGAYDGIVARFNPNGQINWGSYIGGTDGEEAYTITTDDIGNIYVGGNTSSATGMATPGAWQTSFGGGDLDGFIAKIKDCTPPVRPDSISGLQSICAGTTNTYSVTASPGTSYTWVLPAGWQGASTSNSINAVSSDSSGFVKVVAANSCDFSDTVTLAVTVHPLPVAPQIVVTGSVLSVTGSYYAYQWNKDGQPISGATQPTYAPVIEGNYSVTVYNNAGCFVTSSAFDYSLTGYANPLHLAGVAIYPNPATESINIILPFEGLITITDISGKTIRAVTLKKGRSHLSLDGFTPGIYMLKIMSKDGSISGTQKLVKVAGR